MREAVTGDLQLVEALSFKSTSLLSFALAVAAVACAARPRRATGSDAGQEPAPADQEQRTRENMERTRRLMEQMREKGE